MKAATELLEMQDKYFDLVWYARKPPSDFDDPVSGEAIRGHCYRIKKAFPAEVNGLHDEHTGDWEHGFNSGCLATLRLVLGLLDDDPMEQQLARDEFPFLDT